jgi:hypothetical protein
MQVSSEFLIIEDNKAVITTLQNVTKMYEYLKDFKQRIKKLNKEEVSRRLSSKKLGDKLIISEFFLKEYLESKIPTEIKFYTIRFELYEGDVNSTLEIVYDSYEGKEVSFNHVDRELQKVLLNKFLNTVIDEIDSKYNDFEREEKNKFIEKKLKENNIAFCRDYNINGFKSHVFKFKNMTICRNSNLGFGSWSYDYYNIKLDGIKKIFGIIDMNFFSYVIHDKAGYKIDEISDVLKEYLGNPLEFKKQLLKNNIKFLKQVLLREQEIIPKLENIIIPELEKKIINTEKDDENYKKLKEELEKYTCKSVDKVDFKYDSNAIAIEDRKARIELLKTEINNLINVYKSEEDFLDYV